jgi:small subunit ribosomal protein S6
MNKYEIMFIVKSSLESDTLNKITDDLKKTFADKKLEFKDMGQKRFAYPIKKDINGYYYLINVLATANEIEDFKHKVLINEDIIRHLIIKLDEE